MLLNFIGLLIITALTYASYIAFILSIPGTSSDWYWTLLVFMGILVFTGAIPCLSFIIVNVFLGKNNDEKVFGLLYAFMSTILSFALSRINYDISRSIPSSHQDLIFMLGLLISLMIQLFVSWKMPRYVRFLQQHNKPIEPTR